MIKIVVDTEKELDIIRRVLRNEACSHSSTCNNLLKQDHSICATCVDRYCENNVILYKNETVEIRQEIVV